APANRIRRAVLVDEHAGRIEVVLAQEPFRRLHRDRAMPGDHGLVARVHRMRESTDIDVLVSKLLDATDEVVENAERHERMKERAGESVTHDEIRTRGPDQVIDLRPLERNIPEIFGNDLLA